MKAKKGSISYYKKKCDILFSKIVRSVGKCERCNSKDNLQCAHVVSRRHLSLRWDLKNALCLCVRHHLYWQHKEPFEFTEWFKERYPYRYRYLAKKKNEIVSISLLDYQYIYEGLKLTWNSSRTKRTD